MHIKWNLERFYTKRPATNEPKSTKKKPTKIRWKAKKKQRQLNCLHTLCLITIVHILVCGCVFAFSHHSLMVLIIVILCRLFLVRNQSTMFLSFKHSHFVKLLPILFSFNSSSRFLTPIFLTDIHLRVIFFFFQRFQMPLFQLQRQFKINLYLRGNKMRDLFFLYTGSFHCSLLLSLWNWNFQF